MILHTSLQLSNCDARQSIGSLQQLDWAPQISAGLGPLQPGQHLGTGPCGVGVDTQASYFLFLCFFWFCFVFVLPFFSAILPAQAQQPCNRPDCTSTQQRQTATAPMTALRALPSTLFVSYSSRGAYPHRELPAAGREKTRQTLSAPRAGDPPAASRAAAAPSCPKPEGLRSRGTPASR